MDNNNNKNNATDNLVLVTYSDKTVGDLKFKVSLKCAKLMQQSKFDNFLY